MSTWRSHVAITASTCYALNIDPLTTAIAAASTHLNDVIDSSYSRNHRQKMHSMTILTVLFTISYIVSMYLYQSLGFNVRIYGVFLGMIMHLIGDVVTPAGVYFFKKKLSLKLYRTRSFNEYLFVSAYVLVVCMIRLKFGYLYVSHLDSLYQSIFSLSIQMMQMNQMKIHLSILDL